MHPIPAKWWAIGKSLPKGRFKIRRIVSGRLLARAEKREDELIMRVTITVDL
jgi:hypothetical protein